jgi:glycosyltransferase involved in cell wall biosynthesis
MKISLVGPVYPYRGGIAHFTTTLSQKLVEAGHSLQTISFKRQYPAWLYPGQSDKDPSLAHDQVPALFTLDPLYFWTWFRAARQIQAFQPDLVVIAWWTTFWAPAFAVLARWLRAKNIRVVFLIHNVMPHETRFWDRWLARFALASTNRYIVQAEREADRLRSLLPGAKIVITPHPVYRMQVEQCISKAEARSKLGLASADRVILFFGMVRPYKGLRYLLQALAILKSKGIHTHLLVAGEFWESASEYQQLIERLEISGCVHIYNRYIPNEEIPIFFRAADLFAAPYIDATQSGSAKLALGYALPMVVTRCIVDQTLAGRKDVWQVEEANVESLASAVSAALEQGPSDRDPVSENLDDWHRIVQVIEGL